MHWKADLSKAQINSGILFYNAYIHYFSLDGWMNIDADGDGRMWGISSDDDIAHLPGSARSLYSGSYSNLTKEPLNTDNWLITPPIQLKGGKHFIHYYVSPLDENYPEEHYAVMIGEEPLKLSYSLSRLLSSGYETLFEETLCNKEESSEDLIQSIYPDGSHGPNYYRERIIAIPPKYNFRKVYIVFRNYSSRNQYVLALDELEVFN